MPMMEAADGANATNMTTTTMPPANATAANATAANATAANTTAAPAEEGARRLLLQAAVEAAAANASAVNATNTTEVWANGTRVSNENGSFVAYPPQPIDACGDVPPDDRYTCRCVVVALSAALCSVVCVGSANTGSPSQHQQQQPQTTLHNPTTTTTITHCSQQRDFLQCSADFMLAGRYCARSCNRPPCRAAPSFPTLAQLQGQNQTTPPCTDVPPSDAFTCDEQRQFGKCDANFIRNGGFCDRRCGVGFFCCCCGLLSRAC
jgi:hypothetical protein